MRAKDIIEQITHEQVKQIMATLGSDVCIERNDKGNYIFKTICHNGDTHKLYYFLDSKYFHCFTNCGQLSIFNIVEQVKKCTFAEAKQWVIDYLGLENDFGFYEDAYTRIDDDWEIFNALDNAQREPQSINDLEPYNDKVMNVFFDEYYQGWLDDGISIRSMRKFNIKLYTSQKSIIIPHYNRYGELIGIRRRTLDEEEVAKGNKYMPICIEGTWYTHPLQFNLYGLNANEHNIRTSKTIVLVESEKGVMQLDTMYPNQSVAVALCSSNLSNAQVEMILELGVTEVIFALDKQYKENYSDEYKKYQQKIIKLASKLTTYVNVTVLWDKEDLLGYKDSPTDRGKEVFETLMNKRIPIKTKS